MARVLRRRTLTEHDRSTWALYVQLIRPLDGVEKPPPPPEVPMVSAPQPPAPAMRPPPVVKQLGVKRLGPLSVGQHPPGVDGGTWERFRTGKLPAGRTLDLHGRTAARAHAALLDFLATAHAEGVRCVEVITGRGSGEAGGVIRREFPLWLNEPALRSRVLAAAHPHALNPGSVRLLLRRVRGGRG